MYRASTPSHRITIPYKQTELSKMVITYSQNGQNILEKELKDVSFTSDSTFLVTLTQQESSLFTEGDAAVQIRIKTKEGKVIPSHEYYFSVFDVLNDEVL